MPPHDEQEEPRRDEETVSLDDLTSELAAAAPAPEPEPAEDGPVGEAGQVDPEPKRGPVAGEPARVEVHCVVRDTRMGPGQSRNYVDSHLDEQRLRSLADYSSHEIRGQGADTKGRQLVLIAIHTKSWSPDTERQIYKCIMPIGQNPAITMRVEYLAL